MTQHIEWMDAKWTVAEVFGEGGWWVEQNDETGSIAGDTKVLVLEADEAVAITGTDAELRRLVYRMLEALSVDTSSSASRQHYIDTGAYLLKGEEV